MNRNQLKELAADLAERVGLINITRGELCQAAGIPEGSFKKVAGGDFGDLIEELRTEGAPLNGDAGGKRRHAAPDLRRRQILEAAIDLAREVGPYRITMRDVAERAGVSKALAFRYFGSMEFLRHDIMAAAIERQELRIVGFGIVERDPQALDLSEAEQAEAVASLIGKN